MKQTINTAAVGAVAAGTILLVLIGTAGPLAQPRALNPFRISRTAAPSVARADMLACTKLRSARAVAPASLDPAEFAKTLNGTWVRELTWYGQLVVNESALYFNMDPASGRFTAMMYDQSNMGRGPMYAKLEELRTSPDRARAATTMTFLDCDFGIVDKYYKISSDVEVSLGPRIANLTVARNEPLKAVFDKMTGAGFFRLSQAEIGRRPALFIAPTVKTTAQDKVLNEVLTPSVGGAYWEGSLRSGRARGPAGLSASIQGVTLQMKGTYRGAHVGDANAGADVQFEGSESAVFFKEGNAFVAATPPGGIQGTGPRAGGASLNVGGWSTDCADFFGFGESIIWERVVVGAGM